MGSIGRKSVTFTVGVNWLVCIFGLAFLLIALFVFVPQPEKWRPVLIFVAAVLAGAAGLTTAVNNIDQRSSQSASARLAATFQLFNTWNHPQFFYCKQSGREILEHFKVTPSVNDQLEFLKSEPRRFANLIDLLNTFEAMGLAIDKGLVDEEICKRFFRAVVLNYWHLTEPIIRKNRADSNNSRLWKEFEDLYLRWKN